MPASFIVYSGLVIALAGAVLMIRPSRRLRIGTRRRALTVAASGGLVAMAGLALPVTEIRVHRPKSLLDECVPVWQFREVHTIQVAASPERVYDSIRRVRADEILLFRTLTWIRRGGRRLPEGILNAGANEPLIDVATRTSFLRLADEPPREMVIGTVLSAPPGTLPSRALFGHPLPPGFTVAAMNFAVQPDGHGGSYVSTETRVYASSAETSRGFAVYWRVIYPGSALIRRMWLRAVKRRAESV